MSEHGESPRGISLDWRIAGIVVLFSAALLLTAVLRYLNLHTENPPQLAAYAMPIYIGFTVLAAVLLSHAGVPMRRFGFGLTFQVFRFLALAATGVGLLQLSGFLLDPYLENALGETRDLARFSDVAGSTSDFIELMALSWTFAAFGEELAFRIVLMRSPGARLEQQHRYAVLIPVGLERFDDVS